MNNYSNLFVCLMGMGTVFFGLACIVALCCLMSAFVRSVAKSAPAPVASAPADSGALIAAISAAIAEETGTDISAIRIVSIRKV